MIESTDDQKDRSNRREAARIALLVPGVMVRVYQGGVGFDKMKIIAIRSVPLPYGHTDGMCTYNLYQLENSEGYTYYTTVDFIEKW